MNANGDRERPVAVLVFLAWGAGSKTFLYNVHAGCCVEKTMRNCGLPYFCWRARSLPCRLMLTTRSVPLMSF